MADWQYRIDLKEIWKEFDEEKIDVVTAGKEVAEIIKHSRPYLDDSYNCKDELNDIIYLFENESETEEEFNVAMRELYNWGDQGLPTPKGKMERKMAWIATTF